MTRSPLLAALAFLVSGCATFETPPPETSLPLLDPRAQALEQAVAVAVSQEGGALARRTSLTVDGVEEVGDNLVFDLRIVRRASFGRPELEFNGVSRCPAALPDTCRDKAISALRAAAKTE